MSEVVKTISTTWPKIRFALIRRENGGFEFAEQFLRGEANDPVWETNDTWGPYEALEAADAAMIEFAADYETY